MYNVQCTMYVMLNKDKNYEEDLTTVIYFLNYKHLLTR